MAPVVRRLRVAVSGLGRMGARHALHFLHRTPRAELTAAFTPDENEVAWAKKNLEPWGVKIYTNYDEMLKHEGLEAVCIATVTTVHAEQTIKAIEAGKHVLCEKPLSTKLDVCQQVLDTAKRNPHIKVMCGFSRRFDSSYLQAYNITKRGDIGRPTILRSQTCDKYDPSGFFVAYAEFSGGIFVDCNVHDIDLALWYFSASSPSRDLPKVKSVTAVGVTAVEPDLAKHGDVDNGIGLVEFHGGQIAYLYSSRMNAPGLLESHASEGIHREIPQNYYERFEYAFVEEARQFTEAVLEDTEVPVDLESSMEAVKIGVALQDSLRTGKKILFDQQGNRVDEVRSKL
ncbi:NAD-binding Rossmann fold oxidoreductase family protein [Pyrenophora teres f. maculata]|nr:NAD-binding Rossmann fold oxidoreductase family protein [Pyrenophora teres f. maculata]